MDVSYVEDESAPVRLRGRKALNTKSVRQLAKIVPDRRRHRRVPVRVFGRFMREDKQEYPCQVINMSPGSMALLTPVAGEIGERIVAYLDNFGRIEGVLVRNFEGGFAISFLASQYKREKIANLLTWLINQEALGLSEERRFQRIAPRNPTSKLILPNGEVHTCRVIDVSLSGASITIATSGRRLTQSSSSAERAAAWCAITSKASPYNLSMCKIRIRSNSPSAHPRSSVSRYLQAFIRCRLKDRPVTANIR
jgi:hypothetical protein